MKYQKGGGGERRAESKAKYDVGKEGGRYKVDQSKSGEKGMS